MANCSKEFRDFNSEIRLSDYKRENLQISRDAVRTLITNEFKGNGVKGQPQFQAQGSYVTDTIINPIDSDYDLDDGVYFIGGLTREERPTPEEFHKAIILAVQHQTNEVFDKDTCVRVRYAEGYHIDLPIYYASFRHPDLAHKKLGWILSNALEFIAWFEEHAKSKFSIDFLLESIKNPEYRQWAEDVRKNDVQLRRVVRYFKAWADFQGRKTMPSGICLTILATESFKSRSNDDDAFLDTATAVLSALRVNFKCLRPTTPKDEDLFADYTATQRQYFMERLERLVNVGQIAIRAEYASESCALWRKHLGDRFKCTSPAQKPHLTAGLAELARPSKPYCKT